MIERRSGLSRFSVAAAGAVLCLSSHLGAAVTPTGEVRQPRNIYELVYAFEHTFAKILNGKELKLYRTLSPREMKETNPELYERISRDVTGWTDEWLQHLKTTVDPMPEKRLNAARRTAEQVDGVLRGHFETRKWPYRPMRVVFLPPRMFLDERNRGSLTSGMFIPYYPDAFFAAVDWPVPMELLLVHESLHFNAAGRPFGGPLSEGIAETATRYLILKYELLTPRDVRREEVYPLERKGVELILEGIMKRTARSRDEATELFLEAYLTGRQDGMTGIFGVEPWERVIRLSRSMEDWQTHKIKKALEQ